MATTDERWKLIPPLRFDTKEIENRVNFSQAFEQYTGMEYVTNKNIKCLDQYAHKNGDKKPSMHCYENNCRCFTCNKSFGLFEIAARAKNMDVKNDFPKLCEEICRDFGIDKSLVSNYDERERAIKQVFGKNSKSQEYTEYFPFSRSELEIIGLYKAKEEQTYPVNAVDYYCYFNQCEPEDLPKRVQDRLTDSEGKPAVIEATYEEMVDMGLLESGEKTINGHKYIESPDIAGEWKKDKALVEDMIDSKCSEMVDKIDIALNRLQNKISVYQQSHNLYAEKAITIACTAGLNEGSVKLSDEWRKRGLKEIDKETEKIVSGFLDYKNDVQKVEMYREVLGEIEGIHDKLVDLQVKRAEHENITEDKAKPNSHSLPE